MMRNVTLKIPPHLPIAPNTSRRTSTPAGRQPRSAKRGLEPGEVLVDLETCLPKPAGFSFSKIQLLNMRKRMRKRGEKKGDKIRRKKRKTRHLGSRPGPICSHGRSSPWRWSRGTACRGRRRRPAWPAHARPRLSPRASEPGSLPSGPPRGSRRSRAA
ncbi:hypothetical protein LZ30DRAFT_702281 [Colletotrichum cereale]|nr:hypothetical protein LZ30DRAFT_702281 [Colletotrichum cereale]